jgi:hypothetical protein
MEKVATDLSDFRQGLDKRGENRLGPTAGQEI